MPSNINNKKKISNSNSNNKYSNIKNNNNHHHTMSKKENSNYNNVQVIKKATEKEKGKEKPLTADEKLKQSLEKYKVKPNGQKANTSYDNKNKNIQLKSNKIQNNSNHKKINKMDNYDEDNYSGSFIDDAEEEEYAPDALGFFEDMYKINKEKKKHEYKGEVKVSSYGRIQEEEAYSRKMGRLQDQKELEYLKLHPENEEEEEEEDEYHHNKFLLC